MPAPPPSIAHIKINKHTKGPGIDHIHSLKLLICREHMIVIMER